MSDRPYARWPTLDGQNIVFVSEDDLWTVPVSGGLARRLTNEPTTVSRPLFSPDGQHLVFTGRDEGHAELYVMPAQGGAALRLTYTGPGSCRAFAWEDDGQTILFGSNHAHPFSLLEVYRVSVQGGPIEKVEGLGTVSNLSLGSDNRKAVGRKNADSARWKRYRGGTAGDVWVDSTGDGVFERLNSLKGNLGHPIYVGERVYFVSDHEGVGNIYSQVPGDDSSLKRHTQFTDFYVRWPQIHDQTIVFHAGADLYLLDLNNDELQHLDISLHSSKRHRRRKFVSADRHLESYDLHPKGHALAINARGRAYSFDLWENAVRSYESPGRQRMASWLPDGRLAMLEDSSGEERLAVADEQGEVSFVMPDVDIGRVVELAANPVYNQWLVTNHRYEIVLVDFDKNQAKVVDRSEHSRITEPTWAPDGLHFAYSCPCRPNNSDIRLARVEEDGSVAIKAKTKPVLADHCPSFSVDGETLYFLSARVFNPIYDDLYFSLGFVAGNVPCLIPLKKDAPSPFNPVARALGEPAKKDDSKKDKKAEEKSEDKAESKDEDKKPEPLTIDYDGFAERVLAFPVKEARYTHLQAGKSGKVFYCHSPIKGALGGGWADPTPPAEQSLKMYDFEELKEKDVSGGISHFSLAQKGKVLIVRKGNRLRVVKAAAKLPKEEGSDREGGWIDLSRVQCEVQPEREWSQMYREAWRLQRDQFWDPKMSNIDWQLVFDRYKPLLERVASRAEFSDLMWEMQGELGTSHAYEMGGDHRSGPRYPLGRLGADISWDGTGWRIDHIVRGDSWVPSACSPLMAPGLNVEEGQYIVAVQGRQTSAEDSPDSLLLHTGGQFVELTIASSADGQDSRRVKVKTARSEVEMRYREWVEGNRRKVHEASDGRLGYIHIPDMGPEGFAEFFRSFLSAVQRDGLVVDARFNRGGHVSQLLLEKLARKRLGYDAQRHGQAEVFPAYTVEGPIVALSNEYAGSDGDIFCHSFKLMELGPLVGTRTWGGVIGIYPRHRLADGTLTTQPEFSFWFKDVGYAVENYGTDPDIEIDHPPHATDDLQLNKAIEIALKDLHDNPIARPNLEDKPDLSLPKLKWS